MRAFREEAGPRRRRMLRAAGLYAVAAAVILLLARLADATLGPSPAPGIIAVALLAGFPIALAIAWRAGRPARGADVESPAERWSRVQTVLADALERPSAERPGFVAHATGGDATLRAEVESLLAAHDTAGPLDRRIGDWIEPVRRDEPAIGGAVGPYDVLDKVGGGGMGVVYRARDRRLERDVALKFLPPHLGLHDDAKQRFLIEAQAAAALDHPNICTVHQIGETPAGQLFIAMPFYDGETLKARVGRGPLELGEVVDLAIQAARGLAKAHERGIVHRDIKPANLIVTAEGVLKIVDFGIAKLADITITSPGAAHGTIAYMSPEQARGEAVDGRSDLWSLGVVLFELLTGERPFRGATDPLVLQSIATQALPPVALPGDPDGAFERILRTLLAKDPARRYARASDLIRDLERFRRDRDRGATRTAAAPAPADEAERLPADGERRPATVVVANLSGYAGLVEHLVPEQLDRLSARIRVAADEIATRHGGVLNLFREDELVMLFGVPAAHEDHATQAVRAALELHERVRGLRQVGVAGNPDIRLHTGVDTGLLVARPGDAAGVAYHVTGEPVHIARRLAAHAGADEVWITPECHRVVGPFFDTDPQPHIPLRERPGGTTPRRVLRHTGVQSRLDAALRAGLTAYVGREGELARLEAALDATAGGAGRLVAVTGEPGLGKSRLVHEFRERALDGRARLLTGRCQAQGGQVAYLPIAEVLRDWFGLLDDDRPDDAAARVAAAAHEVSDALHEFVPLYLHLLTIPSPAHPVPEHLHGDQLRVAIQEAIAALLTLGARTRPGVLLLEDWHWADDASHAVLEQVAELAPHHALLVVVTSRAAVAVRGERAHDTIALEPLGAEATDTMIRSLTGVSTVPPSITDVVHARTGGNPFFIEEICHTLLEEGTLVVAEGALALTGSIEALQLPDTVEAVIRTRLDRLERETREVVRVASVVGREFSRGILERALPHAGRLPNALQSLKAAGLVQQVRVVPDAAFRFKHVLTQEVAYGGLLEHQRKELHGRVASAIEEVHRGALHDHLQSLAFHHSRAERWVQAVAYGIRAADRLHALSEFTEALALLEQCEGWLARLPDDETAAVRVEVLLRQERLCETLGLRSHQQQLIDRLIAILEPAGDAEKLAEVYLRRGDLFTLLRDFDRAEDALAKSLRLRRDIDDLIGERNTLRSLGLMHWHAGRHDAALEANQAALALDRRRGDTAGIVGDLVNLGAVLKGKGDLDRARRVLEEALQLCERDLATDPDLPGGLKLNYILHNLANVYRELGDSDRAFELLERSVRVTEAKHLPVQASYHYTAIAHVLLQQGRIEDSLDRYRLAVSEGRRAKYTPGLSQALSACGEVLMGLDRGSEAVPYLEEAAVLFTQLKDDPAAARMWAALATAHTQRSDHAAACHAARTAADLFRRLGDGPAEMRARELLGRALRLTGDAPEARRQFEAALRLATAGADVAAEARLRNSIGIVAWAAGDYDGALGQYRRALSLFRSLGDDDAVGLTLNSVGVTLLRLGRDDEAEAALNHAIEHHRAGGRPLHEAHAETGIGEIHERAGRLADAAAHYRASLELRTRNRDLAGAGWTLNRLARIAGRAGDPAAARALQRRARQLADDLDDAELRAACNETHAFSTT